MLAYLCFNLRVYSFGRTEATDIWSKDFAAIRRYFHDFLTSKPCAAFLGIIMTRLNAPLPTTSTSPIGPQVSTVRALSQYSVATAVNTSREHFVLRRYNRWHIVVSPNGHNTYPIIKLPFRTIVTVKMAVAHAAQLHQRLNMNSWRISWVIAGHGRHPPTGEDQHSVEDLHINVSKSDITRRG